VVLPSRFGRQVGEEEPVFHRGQRVYRPGIGPFGEPQIVGRIRNYFIENYNDIYPNALTRRRPDFLIPNIWAIEFKIVCPYNDNGALTDQWSKRLLHPYRGNQSSIGDIYKLIDLDMQIRKGIIVITYEHEIPQIDFSPLLDSFELLSSELFHFHLSDRYHSIVDELVHPVHQRANIYGWEII